MQETIVERGAVSTAREDGPDYLRLAGGVFLGLGVGFLTVVMLAAAMVPGYDFRNGAISDLGVAPETALVFNGLLVLAGLANIAGGYLLYRSHGKRWLLGTFVLAGVGAVVAGVFPLDTGAPHSLGALFAFVFFNVQALGLATRFPGVMRWLSVLAGALGLVFVVLMVLGDGGNTAVFGPFGHGGTERLIVYPVMLWLVALGGYLLGGGTLGRRAVAGR
ncbi:DUF998 domain-containing protein [Haloglomus litoreum]|uniref:DUF998 domain-containing protein n=1 Tax=Haloglomus litoreum TaxID=3034026 RepID=UPI0023E80A1E|nr:DUF998 domain-containing protein [Haloglomus sp. DT116]